MKAKMEGYEATHKWLLDHEENKDILAREASLVGDLETVKHIIDLGYKTDFTNVKMMVKKYGHNDLYTSLCDTE